MAHVAPKNIEQCKEWSNSAKEARRTVCRLSSFTMQGYTPPPWYPGAHVSATLCRCLQMAQQNATFILLLCKTRPTCNRNFLAKGLMRRHTNHAMQLFWNSTTAFDLFTSVN